MRPLFGTIGKRVLLSLMLSLASATAHAAATYGPTASPAKIAPQVVQQSATQATSLLAGRISQAVSNAVGGGLGGGFGGGPSSGAPQTFILGGDGKAAGDPVNKTAIWMNIGNSWVENDQTGVDYSGTIFTGLVGVDHQLTDSTLVGVAFGYERPDITTGFNSGTFRGNNFAVSPYASYIINDTFSVAGTVGYAAVDYDSSRGNGAVTADITGHRLFADLSATARFRLEGWSLQSGLGYMHLLETQNAYTETGPGAASYDKSKIRLGQVRLSNKAGYPIETEWGSIMPFGSARLEYDVSHSPAGVADAFGTPVANDRFGTTFGLGADASISDDTYLSIEGTTTRFRKHLEVYGLTGTLRIKF